MIIHDSIQFDSVQDAAKLVKPGDLVCCSMMDGIPHLFLDALGERASELHDVRVNLGTLGREVSLYKNGIPIENYFYGITDRLMDRHSDLSFLPEHLSDTVCGTRGKGNIVAAVKVSPPDENGTVSVGTVPFEPEVIKNASKIIFEVNPNISYIYGKDRCLPLEMADSVYYCDEIVPPAPDVNPSAEELKIADTSPNASPTAPACSLASEPWEMLSEDF